MLQAEQNPQPRKRCCQIIRRRQCYIPGRSKPTRKLRGTLRTKKTTDRAILESSRCYLRRTQLLHLADCVRLPELHGNVNNFLNSNSGSTPVNFVLYNHNKEMAGPGSSCGCVLGARSSTRQCTHSCHSHHQCIPPYVNTPIIVRSLG